MATSCTRGETHLGQGMVPRTVSRGLSSTARTAGKKARDSSSMRPGQGVHVVRGETVSGASESQRCWYLHAMTR